MIRWIRLKTALLLAALAPLAGWAQQTAVPLGSPSAPGAPYGYYRYLPQGYSSGTDEWPLVIYLHGMGVRGNGTTQLSWVIGEGLPKSIQDGAQHPFILLTPQSPASIDSWNVDNLDAFVDYAKGQYRVDVDRIYVTGASMGGGGAWDYAKAHPEKLAAIVPICGVLRSLGGSQLVDVPTWAFHSWGDPTVSANDSINWVNSIAAAISGSTSNVMANYPGNPNGPVGVAGSTSDADRTAKFSAGAWTWHNGVPTVTGSHPNLTLYWDASHDSYTRTYNPNNQNLWDWLDAQDRGLCTGTPSGLISVTAGAATGSFFPLERAFDAQPVVRSGCEPAGGSGGFDAPAISGNVGYIDFGPDWEEVRITATWTRYRTWSLSTSPQTPYAELWWDDDTDTTNDSGLTETDLNFNTAPSLNTGTNEPWLRDRDLTGSPVVPQGRYLLLRAPTGMTDRAKEYAILGYTEDDPPPPIDLELIVPAGAGTASGSVYFPMDDAFDGQPTLNSSDEPEGGVLGDQAPYLANRAGYIDFGPEWYKVRITSTWTQYRTWSWSTTPQTPYAELWWDDDTDSTNDSGLTETDVNFNTASSLNTGTTEPWLRDRDLSLAPVVPQARYLLCRSPSNMTDRAKEYAIVGYIDPNATP